MEKGRKTPKKKPVKLKGAAAVAWSNRLRRGCPWKEVWPAFLAKPGHQNWWDVHGQAGLLYVIRPDVIRYLAGPLGKRGPVLSKQEMRIEEEFYHLCKGFRADSVGVMKDKIIPNLLLPPARSLSQVFRDNATRWELSGWSEQHKATLRDSELDERSNMVRRNLARQAGRLVSSREFLNERDDLRRAARELELSLVFPLQRQYTYVTDADAGNLKGRMAQFSEKKQRFFCAWELMQLATWDLPVPQGPLAEMPIGALRTFFGNDAIVSNVNPEHLTIPHSDQQESLGGIRFPGSKVEPLGRAIEPKRPDLFERVYEMWFCEFALRQRFENMALPRGAVTHLSFAFALVFEIQEERVKEIRKQYSFQFA